MPARLKFLLHIIGFSLAVLGSVIVVTKIIQSTEELKLSEYGLEMWSLFIGLACLHSCLNILLAKGWGCTLAHYYLNAKKSWVIGAFFVSQIGKYVPGNIFHLAGRQMIATAAGYPAKSIAKSTVLELVLLAVVGGLLSVLALTYWLQLRAVEIVVIHILILLALVLTLLVSRRVDVHIKQACLLYAAYFFVSGLLFCWVYFSVSKQPTSAETIILLVSSYSLSWLAGFLTPGAPAGIGVREFILITVLGVGFAESHIVFSVVAMRIITSMGDLICLAIGTRYLEDSDI